MSAIHRTESIADVLRKKRQGKNNRNIEDESTGSLVGTSGNWNIRDEGREFGDCQHRSLDETGTRPVTAYIGASGDEDDEHQRMAHRGYIGPVRLSWREKIAAEVGAPSEYIAINDVRERLTRLKSKGLSW